MLAGMFAGVFAGVLIVIMDMSGTTAVLETRDKAVIRHQIKQSLTIHLLVSNVSLH